MLWKTDDDDDDDDDDNADVRLVHVIAITNRSAVEVVCHRGYFSVYYYTKCVLLKAGWATKKRKMCNIKFLH